MSTVMQVIDLYAQLDPPKPKPLALIYMVGSWVLLIEGYCAVAGYMTLEQRDLDRQHVSAKQLSQQLQAQINQRQQEDQRIDLNPLEQELQRLKAEQNRQHLLVEYLSSADIDEQDQIGRAHA